MGQIVIASLSQDIPEENGPLKPIDQIFVKPEKWGESNPMIGHITGFHASSL
jgi:hypothetical protein